MQGSSEGMPAGLLEAASSIGSGGGCSGSSLASAEDAVVHLMRSGASFGQLSIGRQVRGQEPGLLLCCAAACPLAEAHGGSSMGSSAAGLLCAPEATSSPALPKSLSSHLAELGLGQPPLPDGASSQPAVPSPAASGSSLNPATSDGSLAASFATTSVSSSSVAPAANLSAIQPAHSSGLTAASPSRPPAHPVKSRGAGAGATMAAGPAGQAFAGSSSSTSVSASPVQRTAGARAAPGTPGAPGSLLHGSPSGGIRLGRAGSLNSKKSSPNRVCCNALLAAYARAVPPRWRQSLKLLDVMWQCGGELVPDIVSYNTVMKACGNAQQTDIAFQVG